MFDLEQSIREWRWQMLGDGIGTPVPLEELEVHLREGIERQTKNGLNEKEAFKTAVREIGQGSALQPEFNKVDNQPKIGRAGLLIMGWLASGVLLLYMVLCIEIGWNLDRFSPRWNTAFFSNIAMDAAILLGCWFLAKASRDWVSRTGSLLICLGMVGIAIFRFLLVDPLHPGPLSPIWFRGSLTLLLCLPAIFWARWEWRRMNGKSDPMRKNQPVHSN